MEHRQIDKDDTEICANRATSVAAKASAYRARFAPKRAMLSSHSTFLFCIATTHARTHRRTGAQAHTRTHAHTHTRSRSFKREAKDLKDWAYQISMF